MRRMTCSNFCRSSQSNRGRQEKAAEKTKIMEAEHAPCVACGGSVPRRQGETEGKYLERATCGAEECRLAHQRAVAKARSEAEAEERAIARELRKAAEEAADTHVEVDYGAGFGAHNLNLKSYGKIAGKPLNSSYGTSGSWAVRPLAARRLDRAVGAAGHRDRNLHSRT
jgi:hypothetical protein